MQLQNVVLSRHLAPHIISIGVEEDLNFGN